MSSGATWQTAWPSALSARTGPVPRGLILSLILQNTPASIQTVGVFNDKVMEICRMNDLQVIIATHSPDIVNGYSELMRWPEFAEH